MSIEFSFGNKQALTLALIAAVGTFPLSAGAQSTGTETSGAPAEDVVVIAADPVALARFLANPMAFLPPEGTLAARIASVALADSAVIGQIVSLASAEGVTPAQQWAIGEGLALAAGQLTGQGNLQQGAAIIAAVAQSPSAALGAGFSAASGEVQTAATQPPAGAPGAPATPPAGIGNGNAAAGGTDATGAGTPGGSDANGGAGSDAAAAPSGNSNAAGAPDGAVSPTG